MEKKGLECLKLKLLAFKLDGQCPTSCQFYLICQCQQVMVVFDSDRAALAVQMLWTPIYKQSEEGTINNSSQGCFFSKTFINNQMNQTAILQLLLL